MSFGNRAGRGRQGIRGALFFTLGNSALDARPYSLTGQTVEKASYAQNRFGIVGGGPLSIPKLINSERTFFFFSYFGTRAPQPLPRRLDAAHAARARRRFLAVAHPRRRAGLRPHRPASLPRQRHPRQPPEPGGPRPAPLHAAPQPAGQRAELSVRGLHRQRHG